MAAAAVPTVRRAPYAVEREIEDLEAVIEAVGGALGQAILQARWHVVEGEAHNVSAKAIAPVLLRFFG